MKKTLALTFIMGAVTGSALTIYLSGDSAHLNSEKVKILTKTEYKNIPSETINYNALDIPGESEIREQVENSADDETRESMGHEIADEGVDAAPTQMDQFERSIASESESQPPPEELPTTVPEEAPSENPAETDETYENETK